MAEQTFINLHAVLLQSRSNGPGLRAVVWFQGCSVGCSGCFNPSTHSFEPNQLIKPDTLAMQIISLSKQIEGMSISGGEPFDQVEGLVKFTKAIRANSDLSVILFSGYTFEQIKKIPRHSEVLENIDVLIAGPFYKSKLQQKSLAGSSNKTYHFFTNVYSVSDFEVIPDAEFIIDNKGNIVKSGIKAF